jgi:hypothetical protein
MMSRKRPAQSASDAPAPRHHPGNEPPYRDSTQAMRQEIARRRDSLVAAIEANPAAAGSLYAPGTWSPCPTWRTTGARDVDASPKLSFDARRDVVARPPRRSTEPGAWSPGPRVGPRGSQNLGRPYKSPRARRSIASSHVQRATRSGRDPWRHVRNGSRMSSRPWDPRPKPRSPDDRDVVTMSRSPVVSEMGMDSMSPARSTDPETADPTVLYL